MGNISEGKTHPGIKQAISSNSIFILLILSAVVFLNSLRNGFVWDDWVLMVYNEAYRSFDIKKLFFSKANSLEYLPVRDITLAIDAQIWGMKPFGFHLTNLLLYLASLAVLFKMVETLTRLLGEEKETFIAFWTTLIFALHPLHTEAVNFIAARNNILAALFLFLSFNTCIEGIYKKKDLSIVLSAFFFVCALFSKASVIFYPLFLTMVLLLIPANIISNKKKTVIAFLFLLIDVLATWIHFKIAATTTVMNENILRYGTHNVAVLLSKALRILFFYLGKLFVPYPLSTDYPIAFDSTGTILATSFFGLLLLVICLAVWSWRRGYRLPVLGGMWVFLSFGPILNIFPTSPVVADRYAYLAVLGFGLVLAYLLKAAVARRREVLYIAWGIIAVWGSLSFLRNMDWRSDITLLEAAISVNPNMDRSNLATSLWNMGEYEKALTYLKKERERTGNYNYHLFLGKYLFQSGKYPEALVAYQNALAEGAGALKEAHLFIAQTYEKTGSDILALRHYQRVFTAKSIDPLNEYSQKAEEGMNRIRQRLSPKLDELRSRAQNEPKNLQSQTAIAAFLYELGMFKEAEEFYQKSVTLNPSGWDTWYNLGNVYMNLGKHEDAIQAFEKSLLIKPNNVGALGNIGISYMAMQQYPKAAEYYVRVLDLDPNNLFAAFNLGKIYFNTGDSEKGRKYLVLARSLAKGNNALQTTIDQFLRKID